MVQFLTPSTPEQVDRVREIFLEYASSLDFSLCFQGFDQELASLPGAYAPPTGRLYLAMDEERVAGCVALRAISAQVSEMKRLYVRPTHRGRGLGRLLAQRVVDDARAIGYRAMRLDTSENMLAARRIYESLGFRPIPRYNNDPMQDTLFFELALVTDAAVTATPPEESPGNRGSCAITDRSCRR